jgi:hypothetical protein
MDSTTRFGDLADRPIPSAWTCRLPAELMDLVLEGLMDQEALGTLAAIQSTSRATYTLATPYLYRHIILDQRQLINLFGLFETFPRSHNRLFLQPSDQQPDTHLLDLHICDRLRSFFSTTRTLSLEFRPILAADCFDRSRTTRYRELANGLIAFEESTLWPILEKCFLAMQDLPGRNVFPDPGISDLDPTEQAPLFDDIFSCIRPKHLRIVLPDRPAARLDAFANSGWMPYFQKLRADHVELVNFSRGDGIPVATTSLIINFRQWDDINSTDRLTRLDTNLAALSHDLASFAQVEHLQFVGLYGPSDVNDSGLPIDNMEAMDYIASEMEGVMQIRAHTGNVNNLKFTIRSDMTPEGSAAAVTRILKQSEFDQVSHSRPSCPSYGAGESSHQKIG